MDRVEVVCVTMGQKDLTIADKMHITGDAVFGKRHSSTLGARCA